MENASKALIIAGSVLLSILLVAMGVRIFNGAQSSADETALDSAEITMFNQKFERFEGTQTGSNVKSLLSFAVSNKSVNKDNSIKLPTIEFFRENNDGKYSFHAQESNTSVIKEIRKEISSTHTYTVKLEYGDSGIINKILIYE